MPLFATWGVGMTYWNSKNICVMFVHVYMCLCTCVSLHIRNSPICARMCLSVVAFAYVYVLFASWESMKLWWWDVIAIVRSCCFEINNARCLAGYSIQNFPPLIPSTKYWENFLESWTIFYEVFSRHSEKSNRQQSKNFFMWWKIALYTINAL